MQAGRQACKQADRHASRQTGMQATARQCCKHSPGEPAAVQVLLPYRQCTGHVASDLGVSGSLEHCHVTLCLLLCACSMECVPLYDTLGENAIEFIMNHR
jgi:hypothetical protein